MALKRYCLGKNGKVINIVGSETPLSLQDGQAQDPAVTDVFEDTAGTVNVNDNYDPELATFDTFSLKERLAFRILFQIMKGTVTIPQANLTPAQFRTFIANQFKAMKAGN